MIHIERLFDISINNIGNTHGKGFFHFSLFNEHISYGHRFHLVPKFEINRELHFNNAAIKPNIETTQTQQLKSPLSIQRIRMREYFNKNLY